MKTISQSVERIAQDQGFRKAVNDLLDNKPRSGAEASTTDSAKVTISDKRGNKVVVVRRVYSK